MPAGLLFVCLKSLAILNSVPYLSSYPGYYREPHWKSMFLEISRVAWQVCVLVPSAFLCFTRNSYHDVWPVFVPVIDTCWFWSLVVIFIPTLGLLKLRLYPHVVDARLNVIGARRPSAVMVAPDITTCPVSVCHRRNMSPQVIWKCHGTVFIVRHLMWNNLHFMLTLCWLRNP